jgi:hypothetical protein
MNLYYKKFKKSYNDNYTIYLNIVNSVGFGNILFMIANGLSLSYEYNRPIQIIEYVDIRKDRPNIKTYNIFKSLPFIKKQNIYNHVVLNEVIEFKYTKINLLNNNYLINGYYQSYKYFDKYLEQIKNTLFKNITDLIDQTTKQFNQLKNNKKTILIHVRRGDYLIFNKSHYIIDENHYNDALNNFFCKNNKDDYKIFLFTDDYNSIMYWNIINEYNIEYINENNPEIIFLLMIQFDHYIIANSSLSLISYYFRNNKNATIKFPNKWTSNLLSFDDIIP